MSNLPGNNDSTREGLSMLKKAVAVMVILGISWGACGLYDSSHRPLSESVLRLHVIANSDDPADQKLKLEVKDAVVAMMREEFHDVKDPREARRIAKEQIPNIKTTAQAAVASRGYTYPVQVTVGEYPFPAKSYGNLVFPPGNYQAVRVVIGEGQGKNWWCVLFPPLCLVAASDRGISLSNPREARVSLKCMELIPRGVKLKALSR